EAGANVTESRTAALVQGQGALATQNTVGVSQAPSGGGANIIPDPNFADEAWAKTNINGTVLFSAPQAGFETPKSVRIPMGGMTSSPVSDWYARGGNIPIEPNARYRFT